MWMDPQTFESVVVITTRRGSDPRVHREAAAELASADLDAASALGFA
jgi:hypothetical protein